MRHNAASIQVLRILTRAAPITRIGALLRPRLPQNVSSMTIAPIRSTSAATECVRCRICATHRHPPLLHKISSTAVLQTSLPPAIASRFLRLPPRRVQ
jgi:hypothetical protein